MPLAHAPGLIGIPEIILVVWLGQPGLLALSFARLAALGFGTVALPGSATVIGDIVFLAVKAFAAAFGGLHGFPKRRELRLQGALDKKEENPPPKNNQKTEEGIKNFSESGEEDPPKKIHFYTARFAPFSLRRWHLPDGYSHFFPITLPD